MKNGRRYYIAYGSNLNMEQMQARCPGAVYVGSTYLNNFQLLFGSHNGSCAYLTIRMAYGETTPVGIWSITQEDEANLDRYEGCPRLYGKETCYFYLDGYRLNGIVYVMNKPNYAIPPTKNYVDTCSQGYKDCDIPMKYLKEAYDTCMDRYELALKTRLRSI